jgi:hypothetical protein
MSSLIVWLFSFYFPTKPSSFPPFAGLQLALCATFVQMSGLSEYFFNLENINNCGTIKEFGAKEKDNSSWMMLFYASFRLHLFQMGHFIYLAYCHFVVNFGF